MYSFAENVALIISESNTKPFLGLYAILSILLSLVGFIEIYYIGKILDNTHIVQEEGKPAKESMSVWSCLIVIGIVKLINPIIEYLSDIVFRVYILEKIDKTAQNYYWRLTLSAHPKWLPMNKNIHSSISAGILAIKETVGFTASMARPVFRLVSSMTMMLTLSSRGYYGIIVIISIISTGVYLTSGNFTERKKIKTKHKESVEMADDQSKNLLIRILNYKGEQTIDNIINVYMNKSVEFRKQRIIECQGYAMLDAIGSILHILAVAYLIYITGDIKTIPVIYMTMDKMRDSSYSITHKLNILSEKASGWGPMEKCLKSYTTYNKKEFTINISDIITTSEVQLYGPSGCGKTTFMQNKVIELFVNSYPGQFIYMDQHMRLIKTDRSILSVMSDDLPSVDMMDINTLLFYAKMIEIDNIININTLYNPFTIVSGGEEKRIMTLRTLLPLLLGKSIVKVIFNDEITSGLDYDNWVHVRGIVDILKKRGIQFVTIDHHPMNVPKLLVHKASGPNGKIYTWV